MFSAISIVNFGYTVLAFSNTVESALWGNRIAYLGSAFLPIAMIMIFLNVTNTAYARYLPYILSAIAFAMFIIAASPGYLDVYYKEVSLVIIDGATVLEKVYGPLHSVYLYYLVLHFSAMIGIVIFARITKRIQSSAYAVIILCSVMINIGVWLMEQLVNIDFEILSVSYIASELFLLGVSFMVQEHSIINHLVISQQTQKDDSEPTADISNNTFASEMAQTEELKEQYEYLCSRLYTLTPTEKEIYDLYIKGSRTKDVMTALKITENTVKYHNRNIYSKLGVSSRKQLLEVVNSESVNA